MAARTNRRRTPEISPIAFSLAHLSVIALRFREPDRPSAFRVPLSIPIRGARVPLPAVLGALFAVSVWLSVVTFHEGAWLCADRDGVVVLPEAPAEG